MYAGRKAARSITSNHSGDGVQGIRYRRFAGRRCTGHLQDCKAGGGGPATLRSGDASRHGKVALEPPYHGRSFEVSSNKGCTNTISESPKSQCPPDARIGDL
ncbi:unnamed protein product [Ostreobium quekettii]|uniref:Uncharacterized protein n=1 Tax=Ostreobium quekettii TaxID=121088 RepID=A0A8S1IW40_9CHLO|nr:unnamed protein product [Ostreobium quekettii]